MYNPQIYTLIETAEAGSFAKAAERLHITPVSVMNQINALEARWGVRLFERTNRGVVLTAAGRSLCVDAKRMIAESEVAVTRAREISGAELRTVKIGTSVLRPCAPLLELWKHAGEAAADFQINIAPFSDDPSDMEKMLASLGTDIDCFVSPCDSVEWERRFCVVPLFTCKCRVAVPGTHRLASKEILSWEDMEGERLMLVRRGVSRVLDRMRDEIEARRKGITVIDIPNLYDMEVFNECERGNRLMEVPETWAGVHPSVVTLPVEWDYEMPFGVVCAKRPSPVFSEFLKIVEGLIKEEAGA